MKKNVMLLVIGFAMLLVTGQLKAQYVLKEANEQFELYNYEKAIQLYTAAYQKKKSLLATERLAESYKQLRDFKQAASWYALLTQTEGAKPEAFRDYADMLRNTSKYSEAKVQYAKYASLLSKATPEQLGQIAKWQQSCDSAQLWMANPKRIGIDNQQALNSAQSDWAAVSYQNGVVFTSDRTDMPQDKASASRPFLKFDSDKLPDRKTYGWTGNSYLKLYQQGANGKISQFPLKTGSNYHVGSASFSADQKEVYFTLTRIPEKIQKVKGSPSTINIEIYSSKMGASGWSEPMPFKYNNIQEWSVGDPYLTTDGSTLYFVSNKPGGKGGTDIYYCSRNADGSWGDAVNLQEVNTVGNERSPVYQNGIFYFATDDNIGMGGLDIFKTKLQSGVVENMGYPINSPQDDFAFQMLGVDNGYLSSNRDGGAGQDDIYSFMVRQLKLLVRGKVFNQETKAPLRDAVVSLARTNGSPMLAQTDAEGNFKFNLEEDRDYELLADKTNFRTATAKISTKGLSESSVVEQDLYLTPIVIDKPIRIENIYYDFDKSNIRKDAAVELDKLVAIMKENPTIWVELGSHTDSRGKDQYNQWLSQSRANSAVQYIIDRGIDKSRITAKGYGESVPVNQCTNGVKCSEADHQLNRRTEFKIVKQ